MPHNPNPPTASDAPSPMSATVAAADAISLSMSSSPSFDGPRRSRPWGPQDRPAVADRDVGDGGGGDEIEVADGDPQFDRVAVPGLQAVAQGAQAVEQRGGEDRDLQRGQGKPGAGALDRRGGPVVEEDGAENGRCGDGGAEGGNG